MTESVSKSIDDLINFEKKYQISILKNEARLLHVIKTEPGKPIKYYFSKSGLSYRGFYNVLQNLLESGVVKEVASEADRRIRMLV
ncbi:MAG: hypothetical protein RIQ68_2073 [Pseudomonadota bacterium]|jgi:predicted transcriptional regulator